jgi:hypothetical protein
MQFGGNNAHEKVTQTSDKGIFELALTKIAVLEQIEKFQDVGIFKQMQRVGLLVSRYARFRGL